MTLTNAICMPFLFVVLHALLNHRIPAKFTLCPASERGTSVCSQIQYLFLWKCGVFDGWFAYLWKVQHHLIKPPHAGLKGEQRLKTDLLVLQQAWTKSLKMQLHTTESMSLWIVSPLGSMGVANGAKGGIVGLKRIQDIWNDLYCVPPLLLTTRTIGGSKTEELIVIKACRPRLCTLWGQWIVTPLEHWGKCNYLIGQFECLTFGF